MDTEAWARRNPFTIRYVEEEVEFYGLRDFDRDGIRLMTRPLMGRVDDYLNMRFRAGAPTVPTLFIDGELWMSLTPMEVQSQHLPIQFAQERVATCGLGMGHFVLRAMAKAEVNQIDVYERDERIIRYFCDHFADREGFKKVKFILGDARENMIGKEYEFAYVDIYPTACSDAMIEDIRHFNTHNDIEVYHWWTRERVVLVALSRGQDPWAPDDDDGEPLVPAGWVDMPTLNYLGEWMATPLEEKPDRTMSDLQHQPHNDNYVSRRYAQDVLDALDDLNLAI